MDDLLEYFLIEGRELVQAASDDLLALERTPDDAARLDGAFRAVHTLKGGAALFADLAPMGRALHAAEDLLGALRAGRRSAAPRDIDAVMACVGTCEAWLDAIAATGTLPGDAAAASARLVAALAHEAAPAPPVAGGMEAPPPWLPALLQGHGDAIERAQGAGRSVTALRYRPNPDSYFLGDDPVALLRAVPELIGLALSDPRDGAGPSDDPFTCRLVIDALTTATLEAVLAPFRFVADQVETAAVPPTRAPPVAPPPPRPAAPLGLRVDPAQVDALLGLAGELVAAKNRLDGETGAARADLDRLVGAVYAAALRLRLVPLSATFRRLPRVVRDAASQLGRAVDLVVHGETVELDRRIVDGLHEPLLHALRNAVGHGIEPPEARRAAGKPPQGRILLQARQDAEAVVVEVSDDGAGIDPGRIRAAAVARGLLDDDAAAALDDAAALDLVFAPGFSTVTDVTAISGRGVGMDVVRASVAALGGRVALSSQPGRGTTLSILLPRSSTLATVLTVEAGGERYGVPAEAVGEILRLPQERVLPTGFGDAFVLRDRTVPLLELARLLGAPARRPVGDALRVLVVPVQGEPVGLAVDAVGRRLDVLLRPPAGLLAAVPGLLGTALLGDGGVLMVLDVAELTA